MSIATFDTQAAADTLREAGVEEAQAKATVAMVRDAIAEGVATKTDIAELKADHARLEGTLKEGFARLEGGLVSKADLRDDRKELKNDLYKLAGVAAGIAGIAVAVVKLLP